MNGIAWYVLHISLKRGLKLESSKMMAFLLVLLQNKRLRYAVGMHPSERLTPYMQCETLTPPRMIACARCKLLRLIWLSRRLIMYVAGRL